MIYWRAEAPAEAVGGRVLRIEEKNAEAALAFPNTDSALPWRYLAEYRKRTYILDSRPAWEKFTKTRKKKVALTHQFLDLGGEPVVFTRPDIARAVLGNAMRAHGVRTIAEADDNYFAPPRYNLFARTQITSEKDRQVIHGLHAKAMASMGVNVFSTAWLRDRYWRTYVEMFGRDGLPEMHVARNNIARSHWPTVPEHDGPLRVGMMGSPSHVWDAHRAYTAFHAAKHRGCETTVIGYDPSDPDPHIPDFVTVDGKEHPTRSKKSMKVSATWGKVIDRHIPWVSPDEYHRAALPLDIGLAPLRDNDFCRGKSDCKLLEYTISGAACVAQKHPIFLAQGWKHEVNCLFAKSPEDMAIQTLRLIDNPDLRAELVANAQAYVREERNEATMVAEWSAVLNG